MKKSTVILIAISAMFVACGWMLFDSFGIWLILAGALSATAAGFVSFRRR